MIGIIDYGLGNVSAFENIYRRLNIPVTIVRSGEEFAALERIILPGVGAFDQAMSRLMASGMRDALEDFVVRRGRPLLGVCVGMQMLARRSEEGDSEGLGWIKGDVLRLRKDGNNPQMRLPHMGWNDVYPAGGATLFRGLESKARFYFLHSYYFSCERSEDVTAETDYGERFACGVGLDNIHGVQFHPEKSHAFGVQLLRNFAEV